jgi:hypothetical protein
VIFMVAEECSRRAGRASDAACRAVDQSASALGILRSRRQHARTGDVIRREGASDVTPSVRVSRTSSPPGAVGRSVPIAPDTRTITWATSPSLETPISLSSRTRRSAVRLRSPSEAYIFGPRGFATRARTPRRSSSRQSRVTCYCFVEVEPRRWYSLHQLGDGIVPPRR